MSHYTVLVQADNEAELDEMLKVYDETLEVEPYEQECPCVSSAARIAAQKAVNEADINIEIYRERFFQKHGDVEDEKERQRLWEEGEYKEYKTLYDAAYNAVYDNHPMKGKPDPECEDCSGTGLRVVTYNPDGKWDWYSIGGRWSGKIPNNTGTGQEILDIGYVPFAVLTEDGWFEKGEMWWFAMVFNEKENWPEEFKKIMKAHLKDRFYLVDCHI